MARILIMDDEEHMRDALRSALERDGHEVRDAPDGIVGTQMFRDEPADVVITDLIMPRKDGIETIRDFRREFPGVKILALSGRGGIHVRANLERALQVGADLTLAKPCEPDDIRKAVRVLSDGAEESEN